MHKEGEAGTGHARGPPVKGAHAGGGTRPSPRRVPAKGGDKQSHLANLQGCGVGPANEGN